MNINTDEILEASGIIAITVVGVVARRSLRKTLVIAGLDEKLAKRIPGALSAAITISTLAVLTSKRSYDLAYPAKDTTLLGDNSPLASVTPLHPVA